MSESRRLWRTMPMMCLAALAGSGAFFLSIKASDFSYWSMGSAVVFGALATLCLGTEIMMDLIQTDSNEPVYRPQTRRWLRLVVLYVSFSVWFVPLVQMSVHHGVNQTRNQSSGGAILTEGLRDPGTPAKTPAPSEPTRSPNPSVPGHGTGQLQIGSWGLMGLLAMIIGMVFAPAFVFWAMSEASWDLRVSVTAAGLLVLTLAGGWSLIKELKLDFTVKLDVEKLAEIAITNENVTKIISDKLVPRASLLALDQGSIGPFASGEASIGSRERGTFAGIARKLADDSTGARPGQVLITGSADRRPLSNLLKMKFGSNMGLARARAEWARERLEDEYEHAGVPPPTFQILVLPPKYTAITTTAGDMQKDRTVSVRAISVVTAR